MEFLEFEVSDNGYFTVENRVYEQIKGVATRGTCSAHLASIYCIMHEHQFYRCPTCIQRRLIFAFFDPSVITFLPMCFWDNLVGLARNVTDLSSLSITFMSLPYDCPYKKRDGGTVLSLLQPS